MSLTDQHPSVQLVTVMNRVYTSGMTTSSGGNLSILDEEGDLWITPSAVDKGTLEPEDICRVRKDGGIEGRHKPSSEHPFHKGIYERRPDLRAVVHAHPPALVAFSVVRLAPDLRCLPYAEAVGGKVGYLPYALIGSQELGDMVAGRFAEGADQVVLENHGIVTAGADALQAFQRLETLEAASKTLILARRLGGFIDPKPVADKPEGVRPEALIGEGSPDEEWLRREMVGIVRRACGRRLMTSAQGTVSARLEGDRFLITPEDCDRWDLTEEDLVLIDQGRRQKGKRPDVMTAVHEAIYRSHRNVRCVIAARPSHGMAFAVTMAPLDTRCIPESYMFLPEVPRAPREKFYASPQIVVEALGPTAPALLIENDSVLVTGKSILQTFDRLEVLEFTAEFLLNARLIGEPRTIAGEEIRKIEEKFLVR